MADSSLTYTTRRFEVSLPVSEYLERYRRSDYFLQLCKQCGNYARRYGCPPFDYDVVALMQRYTTATIIGVQIVPDVKQLPLTLAQRLMAPVICQLSAELLERERLTDGLSFGFAGGCMLCGDTACARITGEPCRHPDKVRSSLESYGFDLAKTSKELFNVPILWSTDSHIPDYLMLICGIFN